MRIEIQPSARRDLREGFRFYEKQENGLGAYFLDSLQLFAGIHSIHFDRFHRLLSKRFPYAVYYQMDADVAQVRAVLDLRRDPESIKRKLQGLA